MGVYRIGIHPQGVEVRQLAVFPSLMGICSIAGGGLCLYLWQRDLQNAASSDFWMVLLIGSGVTLAGLFLVWASPISKRALFISGSRQLILSERGVILNSTRTLAHAGIESMSIHESDSDGFWYTPTVKLTDGTECNIGFGCGSTDEVQSVIDEIATKYSEVGKRNRRLGD